jgi:hypothetical protein
MSHYREEKKSPLNSGNVEQHNNLPCWGRHSLHIPKHPLHNNTEKHMAYGESIMYIKYVPIFSTNTN